MFGKKAIIRYLYLFISIFVTFIITYKFGLENNKKGIQMVMMGGILLTILILRGNSLEDLFSSNRTDRNRQYHNLILMVLMIGFIMRIGYMLYTPCVERGHDIGELSVSGTGHAGYILNIFQLHQLPKTNDIQYYHPPLFHFLSAMIITVTNKILKEIDPIKIIDGAKIISCFVSCAALFVVQSLCKELKLSERATFVTLSILAIFPNFFLLAGRVNNDSLLVFFLMLSILYTFKWYHNPNYSNLIGMALSIGLGMMTKVSCGVIALFTGSFMIYVLMKQWKEKKVIWVIKQYIVFAVICFPLGLWYPIRNYHLFHQPFGYVYKLSENFDIYCGYHTFHERFFSIPIKTLFSPVYANPFDDYNILLYTIKCSIFGEFTYQIAKFIPIFLLLFNIVLIIISILSMVTVLIKRNDIKKEIRYGLTSIWAIEWVSYLYFNIKYAFGCTMDFRYIVPTAVIGALFIGMSYDSIGLSKSKFHWLYKKVVSIAILGFAICSILMYCNID